MVNLGTDFIEILGEKVMILKRVLTTIFIILVVGVYAAGVYAGDTVLELIPEDSTGFVYMGNPMRLSQKIDKIASDMSNKPKNNLLAKMLADAFGADFQSLDEVHKIGFDLKKDFCISGDPKSKEIAVVTHVHDANGVKSLLQKEAGSMQEKEYAGIKYSLGHEGVFAVFDDMFVMARLEDVFKKIIDTYKKKSNSILQSSDYKSLKLELSEEDEAAIFVDLNKIVQNYSSELQKFKQEAKNTLKELPQAQNEQKAVSEIGLNLGLWMAEQLDLYCLTADLEGSTAQFNGFVKFKDESEIQQFISTEPTEPNLLKLLPHGYFLAGNGVFKEEDGVKLFNTMLEAIQEDVDTEVQAYEKFTDGLEEFYSHFGREFAFGIDLTSSMMPDILYIYETEDDESAAEYMKTGYLEYLKLASDMQKQIVGLNFPTMGMSVLANATLGETETYDGIEIQQIKLPDMDKAFADMPKEMESLIPKSWSSWYAIEDGKMILTMSSSSEPIKQAIDVMNGYSENIESDKNYDMLTHSVAAKNNLVAYFSLAMLTKKITKLIGQANPDAAGMFSMMFNNLPESYNIVASSSNRDKGVEFNTIIKMDELKQLIQMLLMASQQLD